MKKLNGTLDEREFMICNKKVKEGIGLERFSAISMNE